MTLFPLKYFTLKEEHIKLLRRANVRWENIEFGAPAIDGKRPYGNSDVINDIAEILGYDVEYNYNKEGELKPDIYDKLNKLHYETETALQIVLSAGSFEPGKYTAHTYGNVWKKAPNA